ncbi:GNAT family N-acetyltransferase [Nocardioides rubriscoriae]|uniref:GNAT family N-acetyltransferase n=1 Tax=Nocardioides rubriscoriae TaxID=642762 RepID=UPI001478424F|nr:GNAT family N-acetyltransferase [Nocardioides rubriscoriae]
MSFPDDVPLLTDGVVTLRAHRDDDLPRIVEQCNDPESVRWTHVPQPYGVAQARAFLDDRVAPNWADDVAWELAIEHEGRFAGTINLRPHGIGEAEVGFGLHPDARGRGVMGRALGLLLDWGFTRRDVAVVHWRCLEGNWTSRRTAWSVGFRFGPTIPGRVGHPDRWTAWLGRDDPRTPTTRWLDPVPLEGDGVRLRAWRAGDGARLVEAAHDPALRTALPHAPLPRADREVAGYLLRVGLGAATGERVAWCVTDAGADFGADAGRALGNVAVFGFDDGSAEVGFWSHPEGRGRGVMTTAVGLAVAHALAPAHAGGLGVRRLDLLTAAANRGARAVAERAGFTLVGVERASSPTADDGWTDTARYERVG